MWYGSAKLDKLLNPRPTVSHRNLVKQQYSCFIQGSPLCASTFSLRDNPSLCQEFYIINMLNKNAKALKIHSVIYWSISIKGHHISRRNMSLMYKIALFSSFADQIWLYLLLLSTDTLLLVLAAILDFWRKWLFYKYFDIYFTLHTYFQRVRWCSS